MSKARTVDLTGERRVDGRLPIARLARLSARFLEGHQKNKRFGSALALEEDFEKFFRRHTGMKLSERRALKAYVSAVMGVADRVPRVRDRSTAPAGYQHGVGATPPQGGRES